MRAIIQRVKSASVSVDGHIVSSIGRGMVVFAAVARGDTPADAELMAARALRTRLWDGESVEGQGEPKRWKRAVKDVGGEVLCISQFTLYATTKKATPDMHHSATAAEAETLYRTFLAKMRQLYDGDRVKDGVFQAQMDVALVNEGPVTIQIDLSATSKGGGNGGAASTAGLGDEEGEVEKRYTLPTSLLD